MAAAKQPHPATAAKQPHPTTAAKQPHPHYTAQSAKQLHAPVPGHNQAKKALLYSNTTAKQLEPLAKRAASTCL